jgi:hypothetical protein
MPSHFGHWFQTAQDILFGLEFLIVQVWLIVHMVRALFLSPPGEHRRRKNGPGGTARMPP